MISRTATRVRALLRSGDLRRAWSLTLALLLAISPVGAVDHWRSVDRGPYALHYTEADATVTAELITVIDQGLLDVRSFFGGPYRHRFDVFVHPDRHSLDSTWRKDWNMPDFASECWMVASGVGPRLDLLSPRTWDDEACEHPRSDTLAMKRLITHELVHVFHGQLNASPDFSGTNGLDWFVEGLATYASGQCDPVRLAAVKAAIIAGTVPRSMDGFWSGELKYGLSGSLVMYLDHTFGRGMLLRLLPLTSRDQILEALHVPESGTLEGWSAFMLKR